MARAKNVGGINKYFGHALYFFEDLLLPPPHTYFLIDFKEILITILAKVGEAIAPQTPPWPRHKRELFCLKALHIDICML